MSDEYARVRIDACEKCGQPLTFSTRFKKFGSHTVEVCEYCKEVRENGKVVNADLLVRE